MSKPIKPLNFPNRLSFVKLLIFSYFSSPGNFSFSFTVLGAPLHFGSSHWPPSLTSWPHCRYTPGQRAPYEAQVGSQQERMERVMVKVPSISLSILT